MDEHDVRHCNWVRFLRSSNSMADVNIEAMIVDGDPVFRTLKSIAPNEELCTFFEEEEKEEEEEVVVVVEVVEDEVEEEENLIVDDDEQEEGATQEVETEESSSSSAKSSTDSFETETLKSPPPGRLMTSMLTTSYGVISFMSPEEREHHFSPVSDVSVISRDSTRCECVPYKAVMYAVLL